MRRRWVAIPSALVVTLASCTGSDTTPSPPPSPTAPERPVAVVEEALSPPGTELAPGVEVQDGSILVGPTVPLIGEGAPFGSPSFTTDIGWEAVLVVDGDPVEVWDSYVRGLGLDDDNVAAKNCGVLEMRGPDENGEYGDDIGVVAGRQIRCFGTSMTVQVGDAGCDLRIEDDIRCDRSVSHLYLSVRDEPLGGDYLPNGTGVPEDLELAEDLPSRLPEPGERYDDGLDRFLDDTPIAVVPEGARSLVAPAMVVECNSGLIALLDVPGAPTDAIARFGGDGEEEQIYVPNAGSRDGRQWAHGVQSATGGYRIDLTAVDTGNGRSAVLILECGD